MDHLICNPGLYYVTEQIFKNLSSHDLGQCRLVSRNVKDFIDNNKALDERKRSMIFNKIQLKVTKHVQEKYEEFKYLLFSPYPFFKAVGDKFMKELVDTQAVFLDLFNTTFETSDLQQVLVFIKNNSFNRVPRGQSCPFVKMNLFQLAFLKNNVEIVAIFLKYLKHSDVEKYLKIPLKELNLKKGENDPENLYDLALNRGHSELLDLIWDHDPKKGKLTYEDYVSDADYIMKRFSLTRFQ